MNPPRPSVWLELGLALALALVVRWLPASYNFVIGTDEALYLTLAQHLAAGHGFTADGIHPHSEFDPGYPLFAAGFYIVEGVVPSTAPSVSPELLEIPAKANLLFLGALLVVPIYFLADSFSRSTSGRVQAFKAALLVATIPALALGVPNFEAASEQMYAIALWTGWALLWLAIERRPGLFFFAGLAFGLAHIVRWEGIVSALAGVLAVLLLSRSGKPSGMRQWASERVVATLVFLLGVSIFAVPYALYQTVVTGTIFSSKSIIHQLHGEALASPDPFAWEKAYSQYELVRDDPSLYPPLPIYLWQNRERTVFNYIHNWGLQLKLIFTSPTFLALLWLPFALLGFRQLTAREDRFLLLTLTPLLVFPISVVDGRYLLTVVPAGVLWVAAGVERFDNLLPVRGRVPHATTAVLLAVFIAVDLLGALLIPRPTEYRTEGVALRSLLPPQSHVLMRKRQLAFYSGTLYEWLPFADWQGVQEYATMRGARYVALDKRTTSETRPQLVTWLGTTQPPGAARLFASEPPHPVVVFRLLSP